MTATLILPVSNGRWTEYVWTEHLIFGILEDGLQGRCMVKASTTVTILLYDILHTNWKGLDPSEGTLSVLAKMC
jgi:hypothetical protein